MVEFSKLSHYLAGCTFCFRREMLTCQAKREGKLWIWRVLFNSQWALSEQNAQLNLEQVQIQHKRPRITTKRTWKASENYRHILAYEQAPGGVLRRASPERSERKERKGHCSPVHLSYNWSTSITKFFPGFLNDFLIKALTLKYCACLKDLGFLKPFLQLFFSALEGEEKTEK